MKQISRREFVKGALAGAAGLTLAGVLGACGNDTSSPSESVSPSVSPSPSNSPSPSPSPETVKGTYTPGTYSATAEGFSSDVTVTMTFDAESITDVQIDVSGETPDVGGAISDKMIERIKEAQSAEVDNVTGASRSSEAVKQAAANCIAQAKGEPVIIPQAGSAGDDPYTGEGPDGQTIYYSMRRSWVGEAPVISESDIAEEYSADVIVVGANYSGFNCFRMASEKGLKCIVLDSQAEDGFNSYGGDLGHFNASSITDEQMETYAASLEAVKANGGMPVVAAATTDGGGEGGAPGGEGGPGGGGPGGGGPGGGGGNEIYCTDTLEELAAKLGFEGEYANNFVESVKRYDAMAAAGKDTDYAKAPNLLYRISEGPFYAEKLSRRTGGALVTLAGLFVDGNQQCLDQNFEPIPGLFATGNTSGGRFVLQYTAAMNGLSIGFATVYGALLGEYLGQSAPDVSTGDSSSSAKGTQG